MSTPYMQGRSHIRAITIYMVHCADLVHIYSFASQQSKLHGMLLTLGNALLLLRATSISFTIRETVHLQERLEIR